MFLDQSSSPAIIAQGIKILYNKDILEIIYNLKNYNIKDVTCIIISQKESNLMMMIF